MLADRRTSKSQKTLISNLIINVKIAQFESCLQIWKALDQLSNIIKFTYCSTASLLRVQRACLLVNLISKDSVTAELSFEHVEQPDQIQSSNWTRISVQLSNLNNIFCSNPRNLYVTGSVSSGSNCSTRGFELFNPRVRAVQPEGSGCSTRGLGWRSCSTRGSSLNFCPKPNSMTRLSKDVCV